jgi:hypothetical protein
MSSNLNLIVLATSKSSRGADPFIAGVRNRKPVDWEPRGSTALSKNSLAFMMPCATQYAAQRGIAVFRIYAFLMDYYIAGLTAGATKG